jgi:hypothetical protein
MLPTSLHSSLQTAADSAIVNVLTHGGTRTSKPSGEVSAVRTITLDGFDEITAGWSPILKSHGFRIDLRAVFCHSRPHVSFSQVPHPNYAKPPTTRRCELADLLIVIDHVVPFQKINDRCAVLVQAKMLKAGSLAPTGTEWIQHELLCWLPAFSFVDLGYDPRMRNLNGIPLVGSPLHTAEYGGIDLRSSPPAWRQWLTEKTAPWFKLDIPLAQYLAGMAVGDARCSRKAIRGGADDWSFTVDELLRVTAALPISRASGILRGNDNVIGFIADTSSLPGRGAGGGDEDIEGDVPEWPEGPISTVHMTVSSMDERREE